MVEGIQERTRMGNFKFFKGCVPHILLGPILNTWTHISIESLKKCLKCL